MLITGGTIVTGDGVSVMSGGFVRINDGRIVEVGAGATPHDDDIILLGTHIPAIVWPTPFLGKPWDMRPTLCP